MQNPGTLLLAAVVLVCVTLACAGCTSTGTARGVSACAPWKTITWSKRDTPPTIDQVKGNNARRNAFCGSRPALTS